MLCVEYQCPAQSKYINFWMDTGCLIYCLTGKKIYSSHGENFEITPGSILYMKKGAYTSHNFTDERYCALMFFIPDSFFQDFLQRYHNIKFLPGPAAEKRQENIIPLRAEPSLEGFFYSILNFFFNVPDVNQQLLELKLDELALTLFTQPQYKEFAGYLYSLKEDRQFQFKYIIEENYASNLKLEEFAQLCNMSLSTFKRYFVKVYGETPGKWLLRKRLKLAETLILHSDKSVNEISFQCGFESPSHFIRVFKKEFKNTPIQYREKTEMLIELEV